VKEIFVASCEPNTRTSVKPRSALRSLNGDGRRSLSFFDQLLALHSVGAFTNETCFGKVQDFAQLGTTVKLFRSVAWWRWCGAMHSIVKRFERSRRWEMMCSWCTIKNSWRPGQGGPARTSTATSRAAGRQRLLRRLERPFRCYRMSAPLRPQRIVVVIRLCTTLTSWWCA